MGDLRRVEPILDREEAEKIASKDLGSRPELRWVSPLSILVDETYQRDIGERSQRLIRKLIREFAWRKMKPPIVVDVGNGYHCVDGQHTAIAAATIRIPEIPVFVIGAETVTERADSFVAHNRDRVVMTQLDIFRAKVAAGDEDAVDTDAVCRRAGVRLRHISPNSKVLVGDASCPGTIQRLVKRRGVLMARKVVESLVKGGRAPLTPAEIDAVEALMVVARPQTTVEEMASVIVALGDAGVVRAKLTAVAESIPKKYAILRAYMGLFERRVAA